MAVKKKKQARYTDDNFEEREGEVVERNGNLAYVIDQETGEGSYRAPHEIEDY